MNNAHDWSAIVDKGYTATYQLELRDRLTNAPYVLLPTDLLHANIGLSGQEAILQIDEGGSDSKIEVVSEGQENVAPAIVRIRIVGADTAILQAGTLYQIDLVRTDAAMYRHLLTAGGLTVRDTILEPPAPGGQAENVVKGETLAEVWEKLRKS